LKTRPRLIHCYQHQSLLVIPVIHHAFTETLANNHELLPVMTSLALAPTMALNSRPRISTFRMTQRLLLMTSLRLD
jgi:hypothetical protein